VAVSTRGVAAIVGVADEVSPTGVLERYGRDLHTSVARAALADAGLSFADVDGIAAVGNLMQASELAEHLGVRPRWVDNTMTGGSSFEVLVQHAVAAIACDMADVVLVVYGETPRGDRSRAGSTPNGQVGSSVPYWVQQDTNIQEWEGPYGIRPWLGPYALAMQRHMHRFGTTPEQFAEIAVSTRQWAAMNPYAKLRDPITIDDVLASPYEVEPVHRAEVCLVTDGGGACVVTSAARARDLRKPPAYILGAGSAQTHSLMISEMPDLTVTAGVESGAQAFAMAGCAPSDVDLLMTYDSFTVTVLLALEDLGFCAKGEGGAFVEDGRLRPGAGAAGSVPERKTGSVPERKTGSVPERKSGALPTNTNGGGLCYTHPGMYGMFLITEATRQVQGDAGERQVPDVEIAVAHGCGVVLSTFGTLVLGKDTS
jgi:acetyl-CoA acetyltransferase